MNLSAEDLQFFSLLESLVLKRVRLDVKTLCDGINPLNKLKKLWFFDSEFNSVSLGSDVKFGFSVLTKLSSLAFNGYHSNIPFPVDEIFGLTQIQRLILTNIPGFNLSSVENDRLSALKRLCCLDIQGTEFDSSSVKALQKLPALRFLKVGNVDEIGQQTVFDGQVLLGLSALTALRALRIQNLPDLNNSQTHSLLSRLVNLESLSLCQLPSISNAGLRALAHVPNLHSVFLDVVEMVTPWFVRNFDNPTLIRRFLRDVSVSVGDMLSFSPQACGNVLQKHGVISTKFGPQEDEQRLPENAMVNGLSSDPVVEVSRYQKLLLPSADWYQPLSA